MVICEDVDGVSAYRGTGWESRQDNLRQVRVLRSMSLGTSSEPPSEPLERLIRKSVLVFYGTDVTGVFPFDESREPRADELIGEIRRRSGLTWSELAEVFGVDRRALHYWAQGKRPSEVNLRRLEKVRKFVAEHDRGDRKMTRRHLLEAGEEGESPFEELSGLIRDSAADQRETRAPREEASVPVGGKRPPRPSEEERRRHRGFHPVELLGADVLPDTDDPYAGGSPKVVPAGG